MSCIRFRSIDTSAIMASEEEFNKEVTKVIEQYRLQPWDIQNTELIFKDLNETLSLMWENTQRKDIDKRRLNYLYLHALHRQDFTRKCHKRQTAKKFLPLDTNADITVIGFGSIVTGLAMKGSDLDCLVQLPRWLYPPDKSFVVQARDALMQRRDVFKNPFAIVHAKVPIVRFFHKPTGISCDLSFTSQAGVENSKLIRYFLNSNRTAFELAFLVKFWSKTQNLTGSNLMPSYCLTLLVIFFLQQIDMLHSVQHLQENIKGFYIDGWNTAFNELETTDRDNKSLYKLLGEFFKYYKSFEFDKYIISPYLGKPIQRELLEKTESVPLSFSLYKNNICIKNYKPIRLDTVMCVQDPFEHNRNCAVAVHPKLAQKVLAQIQKAASIYELESPGAFLPKLLAPTIDSSPAGKQEKKKRSLLSGVRKNYHNHPRAHTNTRNPNARQIQQNFRQNHFRGRIQRTWR